MKKIALLIFTLIFCTAFSAEAALKTVAIMPIENISDYRSLDISQIMAEKLTAATQNSGRYIIVEREKMAAILEEQGFQNLTSDPDSAVEIGKFKGVNYSIFAKITNVNVSKNLWSKILPKNAEKGVVNGWSAKVEVDIRFVDNKSGQIVFAENFIGTKGGINENDAVQSACKEAAKNFFDKLMSTAVGRVVDVSGSDIYIDQGSESGLRVGDILAVVRETSPIEVNGKIVGMKTISIGKIQVTEINDEYSICKVVSLEYGMDIIKGDVIKRS